MSGFALKKRSPIEAAGKVSLSTTHERTVNGWGVGIARLAPAGFDFAPPTDIWSRDAAMSVPTISRARDLICSAVGSLPIVLYTVKFNQAGLPVEQRLPPPVWANRMDPNRPRQHTLAWLTDDLFFHGRGYLRISERFESTGYPKHFELMRFMDVAIDANGKVTWNHKVIPSEDVVEFCSPLDGLLYIGYRAITTMINLDAAAERFSNTDIPAGWLSQRENSEPLSSDELTDMAEMFQVARQQRTIAALNPYLTYNESSADPSKMQLVEARQHQALELARLANIPPYLVGAPSATGMTYQNTAQAKADLADFGILPFVNCIEQTLGGPNVTPNGQAIRLDLDAWLRNPYVQIKPSGENDLGIAYNPSSPSNGDRPPGRPRDFDQRNEGVAS